MLISKRQQQLATEMPNWSQFLLTGSNRCHGPIAKTSYRGHSTVKPQHWSTWWMSDQNESSHGFTSFEFMHGEACQGREMMWTLALTVCQDFTSLPLATRLKLVICCLAACCQYAWESRFNICGLFLQEWMQLDCFVGVNHPFAYTMQSIILMGLNFPRKHALIW